MRLFTAIDLSPDILIRLERLTASLRPEALIKWSPLDNLHITTKFIGEWPGERLPELEDALRKVSPRERFKLEIRELGWFPDVRSPRVLWAGVHCGGSLQALAQETNEVLAALGIAQETRAFSPHLTLARIRRPTPLENLRGRVEQLKSALIGELEVSEFSLLQSEPGTNASVYRRLSQFQFEALSSTASISK